MISISYKKCSKCKWLKKLFHIKGVRIVPRATVYTTWIDAWKFYIVTEMLYANTKEYKQLLVSGEMWRSQAKQDLSRGNYKLCGLIRDQKWFTPRDIYHSSRRNLSALLCNINICRLWVRKVLFIFIRYKKKQKSEEVSTWIMAEISFDAVHLIYKHLFQRKFFQMLTL